jgi:hypothetical protein
MADNIVTVMSNIPARKVLGLINPNPVIILTSENLVQTTIDPSSPFKSFKSMTLASTTKNQDLIAPKPATANAQFLTVPQYKARPRSKSKPKSKSKSKADFRPVPRSIQLEAAIDDGELDIIGQEVDEGITIPVSAEMEPGTAPSLVPLDTESAESPKSTITSPTPSNQRPKSAESIPPAKLEVEKPTPKQSTLLSEAMGQIPEFHVAPDGLQAPKVSLRKMIRAAKIQKLESRKARDSTATPAASDHKSKSPESIPAVKPVVERPIAKQSAEPVPPVKPKLNKPTFKPSALLKEAMGGQFEDRRSRSDARSHENTLRWVRGSARIQGFERRKSRDPTVTPADYGIDAETVAGVLDSVVKKRLEGVGSRLESAIRYGKEYNQEQGHASHGHGNSVLLPPNTFYTLDYAIDTTRLWVDSMENGYGNEGAKGKGSTPAAIAPECKGIELVKVVCAKDGVSESSSEVGGEGKGVSRVKGVRFAMSEC